MAFRDLRFSALTFPQRWDGSGLDIRVLLIPVGDPRAPLMLPGTPPFAGTQIPLRAAVVPGLADLPKPATPGAVFSSLLNVVPPNAAALFDALAANRTIVAGAPASAPTVSILKALPESYTRAFPFDQPRTPFVRLGDGFGCALRSSKPDVITKPKNEVTWGQLLSYAIRQPLLARELGMLYDARVVVDPALLKDGGWVYVTLGVPNPYEASIAGNADLFRAYAARLPALSATPRSLFGAVLFPVLAAHPGVYDAPLAEAAEYDDGFAKILHSYQPYSADAASDHDDQLVPATDAGIQVGWDDEQVAIWHNRQLAIAGAKVKNLPPPCETPLGVAGYRVDVREAGTPAWRSLCRATGAISLGPWNANFDGEQPVEPAPVRTSASEYWLPRYFAMWRGKSIVVNDDNIHLLTGGKNALSPSFLRAVLPVGLNLLYGHEYEFRTRLSDLTGGGPAEDESSTNPAPAPITHLRFRRHLPPKSVRVQTDPAPAAQGAPVGTITRVQAWRPLMGYPEFEFAGITDDNVVSRLVAMVPGAKVAKTVLGVSDPDVEKLRIVVEVRAPAHDVGNPGEMDGPYRVFYDITRNFPAYPMDPLDDGLPLELLLDYQDIPNIHEFDPTTIGPADPLPIPTDRDVRIRFTSVGHNRPHYWANDAVREGLTTDIRTRMDAATQPDFFVPDAPVRQLNGIILQPDRSMLSRLAQQLDVQVNGLTFSGAKGKRVVFGASRALRHTLSGDHSSITFGSTDDLLKRWIVVIRVDINRDWTWDGLADSGLEVARGSNVVGTIEVRQTLAMAAFEPSGVAEPDERAVTHLIFFDAIDPAPKTGEFPLPTHPTYSVSANFVNAGASAAWSQDIRLPIASNPRQIPQIVSAGIALSEYERPDDYSKTEPRQRALWLEFEEPVLDPNDTLFARVLGYGPDPLLAPGAIPGPATASESQDPPLPIDTELIRVITPGQAADENGLDAMIALTPSTSSNRHFLLPLPPGISAQDPDLFGFWTYELRIGHAKQWSTAQARFGGVLRVAGVQHPAPELVCRVFRDDHRIYASAPYATPVLDGQNLLDSRRRDPWTTMQVLLYTQVTQADGSTRRNILLEHKPAIPPRRNDNTPFRPTRDVFGTATFDEKEVQSILESLSLPLDSPLSVLAVELLPCGSPQPIVQRTPSDPVGANLGQERILRTSPLVPVGMLC